MVIQRLPKAVSATIVSSSSVQSQLTVLKELLENAIDAICGSVTKEDTPGMSGQIYVEVDRDTAGLDHMLVRDDGGGVEKADRNVMCLNCTTSKLKTMADLSEGVATCGFRGEALHFIARLSKKMTISTKTKDDIMVETWTVDSSGVLESYQKSTPGPKGTCVRLSGLFRAIPVRHKFLQGKRSKLLKQMEEMVIAYAVIYRNIRFQIKYVKLNPNSQVIGGECKTFSNKTTRLQFMNEVLDIKKKGWLFESAFQFEVKETLRGDFTVSNSVLLPKMRAQDVQPVKHGMKILTVNNRPLDLSLSFGKSLVRQVNEAYLNNMLVAPSVWYISMTVPSNKIDINIEPEKSDIILVNEEKVLENFKKTLSDVIRESHEIPGTIDQNNASLASVDITEAPDSKHPDPPCDVDGKIPDEKKHTKATNIIEDILASDDSFIEELDSTLKRIQSDAVVKPPSVESATSHSANINSIKDTQFDSENNKQDKAILESQNQLFNQFVNIGEEGDQQTDLIVHIDQDNENDNINKHDGKVEDEWVYSVYDDAEAAEMEMPKKQPSLASKIETLHPLSSATSDQKSVLDYSQGLSDVDKTLVGDKQLMTEEPSTLGDIDTLVNSTMNSPENHDQESRQRTLSSYGTYHFTHVKKPTKQAERVALPKISDASQNTFGQDVQVMIADRSNNKNLTLLLEDDEKWVNRSGIPSTMITSGVADLYKKVSYKESGNTPVLNDIGIYQFK